ncbi:MAG: FkbM family methyltransferase [Caulobacter sp.]|nr:FkbM family methyltransferase [Caulobacter sp.]
MRLNLRQRSDWVAHVLKASFQQHHRELTPLFRPLVPEDAVIIDVGAHAGQFARLFAGMAPRGQVWSFEPSAYARSVMEVASMVRRIDNITLLPLGLSDAPGELVLNTPIKKGGGLGFGAAHLGEDARPGPTFEQVVTLTTLDAFAQEKALTRLDLIKIDIEGWELQALRGGQATLSRFKPALFLEVSDAFLGRAGDSAEALFSWLGDLGYAAYSVPDRKPVPAYAGADDYLFLAA